METTGTQQISVKHRVGAYNERRYSKPWIARITKWDIGSYPVLEFGSSSADCAEIAAQVGDVIKFGQKDYRGSNTINSFAVVTANGDFETITEDKARELFRSRINA